MERTIISTEELLHTNPKLKVLWEKDHQIRLKQPLRTSEEAMAQALEQKRVAGLRASSLRSMNSSTGPASLASLVASMS